MPFYMRQRRSDDSVEIVEFVELTSCRGGTRLRIPTGDNGGNGVNHEFTRTDTNPCNNVDSRGLADQPSCFRMQVTEKSAVKGKRL